MQRAVTLKYENLLIKRTQHISRSQVLSDLTPLWFRSPGQRTRPSTYRCWITCPWHSPSDRKSHNNSPFHLPFTSILLDYPQITSLPLICFAIRQMPEYSVSCIAVLCSLFWTISVLDLSVIVAVTQYQLECIVWVISNCITSALSWNRLHTISTHCAVKVLMLLWL
jgi:hypothetical protein